MNKSAAVLAVTLFCCASNPCEPERIARLCAEAAPRIPDQAELRTLDKTETCQVTLLLGRGTYADRMIAECRINGETMDACMARGKSVGIAAEEQLFCPCNWAEPPGWSDCAVAPN